MTFDLLTAYAVGTTCLVLFLLLSGASRSRTASFDEIDVQRINVRKPDGRLSVVISNEARMPGVIHGGHEYGKKGTSGMIFYNGDGDETGGLTFGSTRTDTTFSTFGHLSFDGYEQDQTVVLNYREEWEHGERTQRAGALRFVDRDVPPGGSVARFEAVEKLRSDRPAVQAEGRAWLDRHSRYGQNWSNRVVLGAIDGRAYLGLNDPQAQPRLEASVSPDGDVALVTRDAAGDVAQALAGTE